MGVHQVGNTIRLNCVFKRNDEEGLQANPISVEIAFMNQNYEELEVVPLEQETHTLEEGVWFYDYTLPMEETIIIYEWRAMYQNIENIQRSTIHTVFI